MGGVGEEVGGWGLLMVLHALEGFAGGGGLFISEDAEWNGMC